MGRTLVKMPLMERACPSGAPQVQPPTMETRSKDYQDLIGLTIITQPPEVRVCLALTRVYEAGLYSAAVPAGRRDDNKKKDWYRRLGTL